MSPKEKQVGKDIGNSMEGALGLGSKAWSLGKNLDSINVNIWDQKQGEISKALCYLFLFPISVLFFKLTILYAPFTLQSQDVIAFSQGILGSRIPSDVESKVNPTANSEG